MSKKILLFAPCAFNLAETSRMLEIAKGVARHEAASKVFDIHFMSDGGDFEHLIEEEGFALKKMEPRLTPEKIEFIGKVDKGEVFKPAFTLEETRIRIDHELELLKELKPAAVLTGSYPTIPVSCQIAHVPLVWAIQSTWLKEFFSTGAGMTDSITFKPIKWIADKLVFLFIDFWIKNGFLNVLNKAAKEYGAEGFHSIFEYYRGDITLVAEPAEFSGATLPPGYYFTGPLIARQDFPLPESVKNIPRNLPLIYFAMGSSGTPEIVAKIVESFAGRPYRVVAPVKFQLASVPGVKVPPNVMVTDWLPALQVNKMADLTVIHGGVGTVMTAAYAGKPVVGVGMQPEQDANIACLVRKGFAIRVPKSKDPSRKIQAAIQDLLHDEDAKRKAEEFSHVMEKWDGPKQAAELLYEKFGK